MLQHLASLMRRRLNMMDDTTSSMSMTFDGWSTYKMKLLFDGWDVATQWEFGLTCIAVAFFAVIYQSLRFLVFVVEDTMHPPGSSYSTFESVERGGYRSAEAVPLTNKEGVLSAEKYFWFRVLHSVLSAATYGLAIILMLMAMSFNPSIFISLVAGYGLGDFIFFARMRPTSLDCH